MDTVVQSVGGLISGFGFLGERLSRGVTSSWQHRLHHLHLPSTTCLNRSTLNISLITILKTFVKRCILTMSRHRFVRNLDLDGG